MLANILFLILFAAIAIVLFGAALGAGISALLDINDDDGGA